ncbi:MAG: T9SS type A sorting domain-containing protein, partial [Phycisphaerae bacterium]|nr:T9SS type A sorting domain-containing protein [Phycisphaerae bacterium]
FSLPERSNVSLVVMDLLGRKVKTIYDKKWFAAGVHEISFDGRELPSGIYFYQMEAGKFSETRKMILMK